MRLLDYQRFVVAYHGCDNEIAHHVLSGDGELEFSSNPHDWLGKGIYFWEYGPHRAYEWAKWRSSGVGGPGVKIKKPAVVGALIHLGNCFDLMDTANTRVLEAMFAEFKKDSEAKSLAIPVNSRAHKQDIDHTKRLLDCAMINYTVEAFERTENVKFHSVRGMFSEGREAFEGSFILAKSHIQIAVRDRSAILGYFKPNIDFEAIR